MQRIRGVAYSSIDDAISASLMAEGLTYRGNIAVSHFSSGDSDHVCFMVLAGVCFRMSMDDMTCTWLALHGASLPV